MSGLEKIRDRILHDAQETADERMKAAEDKASVIKSEAVRDADEIANNVKAKADSEIKLYSERVDSSIDMKHRTGILAAKQEIIGDVIDEARRRIAELSSRDYFDLMLKLIEKHVREGEGTVYFSEDDLARIPAGFSSDVMEIARKNGGKLSISLSLSLAEQYDLSDEIERFLDLAVKHTDPHCLIENEYYYEQ